MLFLPCNTEKKLKYLKENSVKLIHFIWRFFVAWTYFFKTYKFLTYFSRYHSCYLPHIQWTSNMGNTYNIFASICNCCSFDLRFSWKMSTRRPHDMFEIWNFDRYYFDTAIWGTFWINTSISVTMYSCMERCGQIRSCL